MKRVLLIVLLLVSVGAYAQSERTTDFGGIVSAEVEADLGGPFGLSAEEELRFDHNFSQLDRWLNSVGVDYTCLHNRMNIAYALGLFAIFGMIRYRTETIKIREMTYLFVVMGLSIVNGMALSTSYSELLMVNLLTVVIIWLLDGTKLLKHTATKIILYDRIENTKHGKEEDLKADLVERTGLDISKVEVGHIDYLRDVAYVKVYYKPIDGEVNTIDTVTKLKDFDV